MEREHAGISHLVSRLHTRQQNGAAERKRYHHIVEMELSLLTHASVPLKFWDEAFSTAAYLINRTPSRVINYMTPIEKLLGTQPLNSFNC